MQESQDTQEQETVTFRCCHCAKEFDASITLDALSVLVSCPHCGAESCADVAEILPSLTVYRTPTASNGKVFWTKKHI